MAVCQSGVAPCFLGLPLALQPRLFTVLINYRSSESYSHYGQDNLAVMAPNLPGPSHGPLGPSQPPKRPRLAVAERHDLTQPLHVDVEVKRVSCGACTMGGMVLSVERCM